MKQFLVIVSTFLLLISCSSEDQPKPKPVTIYVVGIGRETADGNNRATIWKDGTPQFLSPVTQEGSANDVLVADKNVHAVGGVTNNDGFSQATYWKNGVVQTLEVDASIASYASSICIYNNDVYISGYHNNHAVYWKNGVLQDMSTTTATNTYGIFVNSSGIHIALWESNLVKLWKNGVVSTLSTGEKFDRLRDFYVDKNDVYFLVNEEEAGVANKIKYWKNGVANYIPNATNTMASSIHVANGKVYVSGMVSSKPKYWVNGKVTHLSDTEMPVWTITSFKGNVYCAGSSSQMLTIWKNSKEMSFANTAFYNDPYDIAVAE